LGNFN